MSEQTQRQADEYALIDASRKFADLVSGRLLLLLSNFDLDDEESESLDDIAAALRDMYDDLGDELRAVRAERDRLRELAKSARSQAAAPGYDEERQAEIVRGSLVRLQGWLRPGTLKWSRDGLDALSLIEAELRAVRAERDRLREGLNLCARSNHGKAIELGLSDRNFEDCGDPACVVARDLLAESAETTA